MTIQQQLLYSNSYYSILLYTDT